MTTATATKPTCKPRSKSNARSVQRAALMLKQAADPTRLQILLTLAAGEKHVGALCGIVGQAQPNTSHHICLLRTSGMVSPRRVGKQVFYSLTEAGAELARAASAMMGA